jgi:hypothetical protein
MKIWVVDSESGHAEAIEIREVGFIQSHWQIKNSMEKEESELWQPKDLLLEWQSREQLSSNEIENSEPMQNVDLSSGKA